MSNEQIEIALTKAFQTLIFKGAVDFKVEVFSLLNQLGFTDDDNKIYYNIYVYFTVDHSMYWSNSPKFSREYNDLITNIDSYEEKLNDVVKYIIPTDNFTVWFGFKHFNTDIYKPLLDLVGKMKISYISNFSESNGPMELIFDEEHEYNHVEIMKELEKSFDLDDIVIYFENLSD
jgi:hypothetical protein